ncbi:MAG: LacI family transcriptional regulator [Opitutaceae bacterium]|jgi:LacI family transcriptional regulator|nr:LacI family transcriptional regulator [Opitutaceae bacterium]
MESLSQAAIARQLQVSRSTVSHVLNGRGHLIRPETRKKVEDALKASGYQRNGLVRALKTRRSHVVGIIVPEIGRSFFSEIIRAAENEAREHGLQCFLAQSHSDPGVIEKSILTMREYRVDGILVTPSSSTVNVDLYRQLCQQRFPFVLADSPVRGVEAPFVGNDNVEVGRLATEHLLALGHRHIACIRGYEGSGVSEHRLQGFRVAFAAAGLTPGEALVAGGGFSFDAGAAATRALLAARRKRAFTAIVAPSDHAALGAIQEIIRAGLRVPDDISIVGCANVDIAAMSNPPLTTVDQKPGEIGVRAMRMLIERIGTRTAGTDPAPVPESFPGSPVVLVRPALLVRQSTAAPATPS